MSQEHGTDHSTAGFSAERIGRNDSIFRQANERINEAAGWLQIEEPTPTEEPTPFLCECADMACHELVVMSLDEYSKLRRDPRHFLNVPGHQASSQGWARVIGKHDAYFVVEKIGPAGDVAEQLEGSPDPATATIQADERHRRDDPV
jgi:hypothetical protein